MKEAVTDNNFSPVSAPEFNKGSNFITNVGLITAPLTSAFSRGLTKSTDQNPFLPQKSGGEPPNPFLKTAPTTRSPFTFPL